MNDQETLNWMFSRLPMYQNIGKNAYKKDLTNIRAFCDYLDTPEKKIKTVHVAGTNGKGSTSHMLASILQEAGYKTGLYTSPHLKSFNERIKINGISIPSKCVTEFIHKHKVFIEKQGLSFFEMTVGMAFDYFVNQSVDIAIIEVGLGGRLDSTNIISPEISVITNISYDHTSILGNSLTEIAQEKAGIIKKNTPVIIGKLQEEVLSVFKEKADKENAPVIIAKNNGINFPSDLKGDYQLENITTAVTTIHELNTKGFNCSENQLKKGLKHVIKNTQLLGRWQILSNHPKIICDVAHNKAGLQIALNQLLHESFEKLHLVLGFVNDKNLNDLLLLFPKKAHYYFCKPSIERGLNAITLKEKAQRFELYGSTYNSVQDALKNAKREATNQDLIYVGGSTFVVAEVL